jgi:hypothetical protein
MTARQREIQQLLDTRARVFDALDNLKDNWPAHDQPRKRAALQQRLDLIRRELNRLHFHDRQRQGHKP